MKKRIYTILLIGLVVLMAPHVALAKTGLAYPHNFNCSNCHNTQSTLGATGYKNVCVSCHNPTNTGMNKPFEEKDAANPFGTITSVRTLVYQTSHNWAGPDINLNAGAEAPTEPYMTNANTQGYLLCARCHNVHGPRSSPFNSAPFLRVLNENDEMCRDCHKARDTNSHMAGSHPVNLNYTSATSQVKLKPAEYYTTPPVNANPANPTSAMKLINGKVLCSTCHGVHYTDSNSGTIDGSAAYRTLSTSKGYLLRTDARGKTADAVNICTNCHAGKTSHNRKNQNIQCNDCHSAHVEYDPTANQPADELIVNKYLIRRFMNVSTQYGAVRNERTFFRYTGAAAREYYLGTGGSKGVCQACHYETDTFTNIHYVGGIAANGLRSGYDQCASCHNHKSCGFSSSSYTVNVNVIGGNGTITCDSPVKQGGNSVCTVTPSAGYHLGFFTDNGVDMLGLVAANSYTISNVSADHAISATFAVDTFAVGVAVVGGNGNISCDSPVNYWSTSICFVSPITGYHLASFTDNGVDMLGSVAANSYSISNVIANHAVRGTFAIDTFAVNFASGGNGALTGNTDQTIDYNTSTTAVTAVPATGYHFVNWTGTGGFATSTANPLLVPNVTAAQNITANFAINTYTITGSAPGGNGGISCTTPVNYGSNATCTISPNPGYYAMALADSDGIITSNVTFLNINNSYTIPFVSADHAVTATFAPLTVAIGSPTGILPNGKNLTIMSSVGGINCQWTNTLTPSGTCTSFPITYGTPLVLTVTVPKGYSIAWGTSCDASTSTTCTINNVKAATTFNVQTIACAFTINPTSVIIDENPYSGTVTVTPDNSACSWDATTTDSWITVVQNTASGIGSVSYDIGMNTGNAPRIGKITIADQTFRVRQSNKAPK